MTRIAYICADPGIPVFGSKGASIHVLEILRSLIRRGLEPVLFAARLGGERPAWMDGERIVKLPKLPAGDPVQRELAAMKVNEVIPDLLAAHGPFALMYERYSLWSHAGLEYARRSGVASVLEVNAPLIEEQARRRVLVHHDAARENARRVFAAAQTIVAVSPAVAAYVAAYPGVTGPVRVVPNGIDPARFPDALFANRRPPGPDRPFVIGFLGSLKAWHGVDLLIEAFARAFARDQGLRLLIVGDGPMRTEIETAIAEKNLTAVARLTGAVAMDEAPGLLADMDVGVAPYPLLDDFYFSPLKIGEYMAAGLPVVTSRVGWLEELVEHESTGLLYAAEDADELALALLRLRRDAELSRRLGATGRARVLARQTWDQATGRILGWAGLRGEGRS